jgi:hypothetical protein
LALHAGPIFFIFTEKTLTRVLFIVLAVIGFATSAISQRQIVLLKDQRVILRLYPGDEIAFKRKGSNSITRSYVNNIFPGAVKIHRDTIPFDQIERVYFRQSTFANRIGGGMVTLGIGLFLIDQINVALVQKEGFSLDRGVSTVSISTVAVGLPLMLIKKKSQRINYKHRLLTVDKKSFFYKPDTRSFTSPFMDN